MAQMTHVTFLETGGSWTEFVRNVGQLPARRLLYRDQRQDRGHERRPEPRARHQAEGPASATPEARQGQGGIGCRPARSSDTATAARSAQFKSQALTS